MRAHVLHCLLPVVTVGIPAQTTHLVGPGGFPQIRSALAVAAAGDAIHVLPGTYEPFPVSIGCTIRALTPGSVTVTPAGAQVTSTISAPAGQTVHLVGLRFDGLVSWGTHIVAIVGGRVTLDQCTLTSTQGGPLSIRDASAHLQGCVVTANGPLGVHPGLQATNAKITATDTTFRGSPLTSLPHPTGQPGVDLVDSTFHASGCSIFAGVEFGAVAMRTAGGQVWLSDSSVVSVAGCAISATGPVVTDRCSLQGWSCTVPSSGALLGVSRPNPLQNGATFTLNYQTIPNGYAAIFASQELASLDIAGLHAQTQWLGGGSILNLGLVFADGQGQASASWAIPVGTWWIDLPLWFQGLTGFALPLQLSPVAGGVIR